ncbi:MAG: dihydrofolate reductase [Candidatus Heteroscillospira sp.]|jgi:dihydrofolate reductase
MEAVVAVYSDWGIGRNGTQPVVVSADRKHFREVTGSSAVIVGRKTLADFPGGRPLKNRVNIVITRQDIEIEGAVIAHSPEEAVKLAEAFPRVCVIGGASIYRKMLPWCSRAHVTVLDCAPESDVFFPNLDESPDWYCAEPGDWQEENGVRYRFATYERK